MHPTELKALLKLALPLMASGIVEAAVGFFSTLFLAHLGKHELAAGALVTWLFTVMLIIMWGTLSSVSVLVARKQGANDIAGISRILFDGLKLALLAAIPAVFLLWYAPSLLLMLGQPPALVTLARVYLHSLVWGVPADFIGLVLLQFMMGLGRTRENMFFTLLWIPLNILLNYALIFGKFHLPALGIAGMGWGTTCAFWITTVGLLIYLLHSKRYRCYWLLDNYRKEPGCLRELLKVGMPMGMQFFVEIGFFAALTFFMGKLSVDALAANQIVLQYVWLFSVVGGCLAQAMTIRIGHKVGSEDVYTLTHTARVGIICGVIWMLFVACIYYAFSDQIIGLDINIHEANNYPVVLLAKHLLMIAAVFQILDMVRYGLVAILRGLKDTRFALLISVIIFWLIAMPLGYFLAFKSTISAPGFWWAMVCGVAMGIILLYGRFKYRVASLT